MSWYNNSQAPENKPVLIPSDGHYIFGYIDIPNSGDSQIMLSTDFCIDVENNTNLPIEVTGSVGVSAPSEVDRPLRPFHGVMHSISNVKIPPGARIGLHIIRLDVIDPTTDMPWQLNKGSSGQYPKLAPQVFGPAGVWVSNAAIRVLLIG